MSVEEDATREIFGYTAHITVPNWVDKHAYSTCKHCSAKFSSMKEQSKAHHCRLCGEMYCGSCTGKYHLPLVYELKKGKKGPTRVCIRCRDSCLEQKHKEKAVVSSQLPTKHAVLSATDINSNTATGLAAKRTSQIVGTDIEISPPTWDDPEKYIDCAKCHKKGGKPHNCRTCGHLFCDSCTSKMVLPACFERKKKSGPCRVCSECRFKILGGAKLVDRLSTDLPELSADAKIAASSTLTSCKAAGCLAPRVSKNGFCAVHVNVFGSGGTDLATSASLSIRWEGAASLLTRVALIDRHMNLMQIDHAFKRQCPEFATRDDFEYMYRGDGIHEVFYDIFNAATFAPHGNIIYIRKKVDTDLLVAQYARQGVTGRQTAALHASIVASRAPGTDVAISNNPFRRPHAAGGESATKQPEEEKSSTPKVTVIFHRPAKVAPFVAAPKAPKKLPPPPPPASATITAVGVPLAGGPAGPEQFRARAKQYFGAH